MPEKPFHVKSYLLHDFKNTLGTLTSKMEKNGWKVFVIRKYFYKNCEDWSKYYLKIYNE